MNPYNVNNLPADLQSWIGNRFLLPILNLQGGWEYWIQIDFPAWKDQSTGLQWDFQREVTGIVPGTRLDWLINANTPPGPNPRVAVELKAQTSRYQANAFLADVQKDVAVLQQYSAAMYTRLAIVASCDQTTSQRLVAEQGFVPLFTFANNAAGFFFKNV